MNGFDDIEEALQRLITAYDRFGAARRRQLGLSANEELVLLHLARGAVAPSELSRSVGMTTAGMTNLLDRLEQGGYVRREAHATDKRRVLLVLTKKGFRAQLEVDAVNGELAQLAGRYPSQERETILRFLREASREVERRAGVDGDG